MNGLFTLLTYNNEDTARVVADHLRSFRIWTDYNGQVQELDVPDVFSKCTVKKWCLTLRFSASQYTTTIREMRSSAEDFLKGYLKAKSQFEDLLEERLLSYTQECNGEPVNSQSQDPKLWIKSITKNTITLAREMPKICVGNHHRPCPKRRLAQRNSDTCLYCSDW